MACLGLPSILLVGAEAALRFLDVGYRANFLQPLETKPDYLADNHRFAWRFFPPSLARASQPLLTTADKPANVKRIIVFGGSAAMGDPEPAFGLPRVLQTLLTLRFPDQQFEVINAAVTAINSHVVLSIAADCRQLDADAWVVYMGNNEVHGPFGAGTVFTETETPRWMIRSGLAFKRTRLGQVLSGGAGDEKVPDSWGGMKMFLDHQIRHDDPALDRVYANYTLNLQGIFRLANRRGIPTVVSTVVSNLGDFGPFISLHREGLTAEELDSWQAAFDRGCNEQDSGRLADALQAFDAAANIDDEYAELVFRRGECLLGLNKVDEARQQFVRARDLDGLRFRADSKINDTIRNVAADREGVYFIDGETEFTQASDQQIIGDQYFFEHVHFTFAGNYRLAKLVADSLVSALKLGASNTNQWATEEECAFELGLTAYHRMTVAQEMKGRLSSPPFNSQVHHQRRMAKLSESIAAQKQALTKQAQRQAIYQYEDLIKRRPDDWVLRWQYAVLLESVGELDTAVKHQRHVVELLPHYAKGQYRLGALLNRVQQWDEAEKALRRALALRPNFAWALNSLGIAYSRQERLDEAIDQFRQAVELRPEYAEAYVNWGLVLAYRGDEQGAVDRYRAAVQVDPNHLPAHIRLGKYYRDSEQFDQALPHYSAVARLRNDATSWLNLAMLETKLGRTPDAKKHFQRVLQLDLSNEEARQALRSMQ